MSKLGMYHGASTMMRKILDWNNSRISMLEVEAVPQICIPLCNLFKEINEPCDIKIWYSRIRNTQVFEGFRTMMYNTQNHWISGF
jgi:hypothetical protein